MKKLLVLTKVGAMGDSLKSACAVKSTKVDLAMIRISKFCGYMRGKGG